MALTYTHTDISNRIASLFTGKIRYSTGASSWQTLGQPMNETNVANGTGAVWVNVPDSNYMNRLINRVLLNEFRFEQDSATLASLYSILVSDVLADIQSSMAV